MKISEQTQVDLSFFSEKEHARTVAMCRSQPPQAGQTCIQSAYQLVITTGVKKEQKTKLEAEKSVLHNSTLGK